MCGKPGCNQSELIEHPVVEDFKKKPYVSDTYISSHETTTHGYIAKGE
jgi:hypothetical protein